MVKKSYFIFFIFTFLFIISLNFISALECGSNGYVYCSGNQLCYSYTSNYTNGNCNQSCSYCGSGYTCTIEVDGGECIANNPSKVNCPNPNFPYLCNGQGYCGGTQGYCDNLNTGQNSGYCDWTNQNSPICCNTAGKKVSDCLIPLSNDNQIPNAILNNNNPYQIYDLMDYFQGQNFNGGSSFDSVAFTYAPMSIVYPQGTLLATSYTLGDSPLCFSNLNYQICLSTSGNDLIMNVSTLFRNVSSFDEMKITAYNKQLFSSTFFNSPSKSFFIDYRYSNSTQGNTNIVLSDTENTTAKTGEQIYINKAGFLDYVNLDSKFTGNTCWVYRDGFGLITNVSVTTTIFNQARFPPYTIPLVLGQYYRIECGNLDGSSYTYAYQNSSYCYQESANTTNQGGNDGSCSLNYTGSYNADMTNSILYINYSSPVTASKYSNIWSIKYGNSSQPILKNITIPSDCYNSNLRLKIDLVNMAGSGSMGAYCFNYTSSNWVLLDSTIKINFAGVCGSVVSPSLMYDGNWGTYATNYKVPSTEWCNPASNNGGAVFEEAMFWSLLNIPNNPYFDYTDSSVNEVNNGTDKIYNIINIGVSDTQVCENTALFGDVCCPFTYPIICYNDTITNSTGSYMNLSIGDGQCAKTQGFCNNYYTYFQGNQTYCYVDNLTLLHCCNDDGLNIANCGNTPNTLSLVPNVDLTANVTATETLNLNDYFSNYDGIKIAYFNGFNPALNIPTEIDYFNVNQQTGNLCDTGSGISICINPFTMKMTLTSLGNDLNIQYSITPYTLLPFSTLYFNSTGQFFNITTSSIPGQNPNNPNSTGSSSSFFVTISDWFAMVFPSSDSLSTTQKFGLVFLVILVVDLIILYFGFKSSGSVGGAIAWIVLVLDILLFLFFTAIGYIPIGVVIIIALIVVILGSWAIFKGRSS